MASDESETLAGSAPGGRPQRGAQVDERVRELQWCGRALEHRHRLGERLHAGRCVRDLSGGVQRDADRAGAPGSLCAFGSHLREPGCSVSVPELRCGDSRPGCQLRNISGASSEPVTVGAASPSISTTQQPASAAAGSQVADQATVSGGYSPTGTVRFNLYGSSSTQNSSTLLFTDTETLSGGSATSKGYTTTATRTDYWVATDNGDSNNNPVSSGTAAEPVTITVAWCEIVFPW